MTIGDVRTACLEAKIQDDCIIAVYDDQGTPHMVTAGCFDPSINVLMLKIEPVPREAYVPRTFVAGENNL